jgi:hypothetical protein
MSDKVYFATKEGEQCASALLKKSQTFFNQLSKNAYLDKLKDMWMFYHGIYATGTGYEHQITFTGEQGELVAIPINHFRNLARHIYNMITSNRPTMEARSINTDYKSLSQTYLANNILDYYMREKQIEDSIHKAAEMAIVLGAGYVKLEWNATGGETYDVDPETGEFNFEGEIEVTNISPFDVVVDGTKENWADHEWVLVRSFQNKHNLAAKYPEYAEQIVNLDTKSDLYRYRINLFSNDETDDIAVYEFYHKKTEAVPEGRYMLFVTNDIVLLDTKMVYRELPIFRLVMSEIMGTPYGYSDMFDVYPIQEAINSLYSSILTNQTANAVQNIWVKPGSDFNVESIVGGMNIVESAEKPESLQLTQTPKEVFDFVMMLEKLGETLSGVNSVTRGNPEASLRSGNALALVQSMSLQYMSGFQKNYVRFIEQMGTSLINILKDFAMTPKMIALVGRNNRPLLKEFTGDMIKDINRVVVDVGNPLARTTAGRVQMAEQLLQMGMIKNPQQYFMIMNTGRLDPMFESDMSEILLIKKENEFLLEGKKVTAALLDAHRQHIMEHKAVASDPELRLNPALVENLYEHIQEHINFLRTADADLLQLVGETPLNPPQQQGQPIPPEMMQGVQGQAPGQPPLAQQQGGVPQDGLQQANIINPMEGGAQMPSANMPNQPKVNANLLPNPELEPRAR